MDRSAFVALEMSLNTTNAWPRILKDLSATMSMIGPNWEKMAYSDFFSSACVCVCGWRREEGEKKVENTRWIEKLLDMIIIYIHRLHSWVLLNLSEVWTTGSGFLTPTTCFVLPHLLSSLSRWDYWCRESDWADIPLCSLSIDERSNNLWIW